MRHREILVASLLVGSPSCFKGPPDTYSPEARLSIEAGGPVARVLTYGAPSPLIGQCADPSGGELLPYVCDEKMTAKLEDKVLDAGTILLRLPRGRYRYYSRLTSLEVVSDVKVKGAGTLKNKTAVAKFSMVAEWSRYVTVSNLSGVSTKGNDILLGAGPFIEVTSKAPESGKTIALAGELVAAQDPLQAAVVYGVDYGIGVRVMLDVVIRGIDAEGAASFGFGDLAASIVSQGAEVNVRYDTVGVREDILPPDAPNNVTSVNDLVNVQRAFYGAIDEISQDWNDAYVGDDDGAPGAAGGGTPGGGTPGGGTPGGGTPGGGTPGGGAAENEAFDDRVRVALLKKFQIEPVAYYIYRSNRTKEIFEICDREVALHRLSKRYYLSSRHLKKVREACLCKYDSSLVSECPKSQIYPPEPPKTQSSTKKPDDQAPPQPAATPNPG